MTLRRRVLIAAFLAFFLVVTSAVFLIQQYSATVVLQSEVRETLEPAADSARSLVLAQANASRALSDYALVGTPAALTRLTDALARADTLAQQVATQVVGIADLPQLLTEAKNSQETWVSSGVEPVTTAMESGRGKRARALTWAITTRQAYNDMTQGAQHLVTAIDDQRDGAADLAQGFTWLLGLFLLMFGLSATAFLVCLFLALRQWVLRPLAILQADLQLATNELGHEHVIEPIGPPEIAIVATDAESMRRNLVTEIDAVRTARQGLSQEAPVVSALAAAHTEVPSVEVAGLSIYGTSQSAEGVLSGDWWDAAVRPDGTLGVVIADVSGHGAAPGVTAVQLRPLLQAGLRAGSSPDQILQLAATILFESNFFVTALVVVIDQRASTIAWANAGHEPALLVQADKTASFCDPTGPLLSSLGGRWETVTTEFRPGALLLAFTDGLVESRTEAGATFTTHDLSSFVRGCDAPVRVNAEEITQRILARARERSVDWNRDDVTLLAVARPL